MNITVIGASNVDITAKPVGKYIPCDSNPGHIHISFGGVGNNIARNLCRLGQTVTFLTAFGEDNYASALYADCEKEGMNLSYALRCSGVPSSTYLSVLDDTGDLVAGVSDMALCAMLTEDYIRTHLSVLNSSDAVVFDTNLSEETMVFLMKNTTVPLFTDAVSCTKAQKLKRALECIPANINLTMKANRYEAEVLTNIAIHSSKDASVAARELLHHGVHRVFITLGPDGVYAADSDHEEFLIGEKIDVLDSTGAGDAFLAAVLNALLQTNSLAYAAKMGMAASCLTLLSGGAVSPLMSPKTLEHEMKMKGYR